MWKKKKGNWFLIMILICAISCIGQHYYVNSTEEIVTNSDDIQTDMVIVGGIPIGIYLDTNGVMVIDTDWIVDADGEAISPADGQVIAGDYIIGINEETIDTKDQLIDAVSELDGKEVLLEIRRDEEVIEVSITPTTDEEGDYKLGIWVRDNLQGLGTLTYIDTQSEFGALGHGINDIDTGELLEIEAGDLYKATISNVIKGESGSPGGLEGVIIYSPFNHIGEITLNTEVGIYGTIEDLENLDLEMELVEVASTSEIEEGLATIQCTIDDEVCEYEIEILEIDLNAKEENQGLVIEIIDEELLELTGGIVQGMSGAPILQNGKLVGAVTHVFVNDPTKGYGIFIENMLETAESVEDLLNG